MQQIVRIRRLLDADTAEVVHIRESACSGDCHKCSGCGAAKESILLRADNPIGAKTGDLVKVESATAPVLKAAAVLYMLPLVLFFAGYGLGAALGISGGLSGGLAFALSILLIVVYDRRMQKKDNTIYTITGYGEAKASQVQKKGDNDLG